MVVGYTRKFDSSINMGMRAVRWDITGGVGLELGHLGTDLLRERTNAWAFGVNDAGTAVGFANKYDGGRHLGPRAIRWGATGTIATELGHLGTSLSGDTNAMAFAVNAENTAVGFAEKYEGSFDLGRRAVRWDATGTVATELGNLGTAALGFTNSFARSINGAGTTVGWANKYDGRYLGRRAVRWEARGTIATELGHLGVDGSSGTSDSEAYAINDAGTVVGWADKTIGNVSYGSRAVRWEAGGTAATELGNLGTTPSGSTNAYAFAVNSAGTAVGWADKYDSGGTLGNRAVRWDAGGTAATELGHLGTSRQGRTSASAIAINAAGIAVGWAANYDGDTLLGNRAVYWGLDNVAEDLSDLIHPASGWSYLEEATAISDTGWVTGVGMYDPDGVGGDDPYRRMFLLNINDITYVPEPTALVLMVVMGVPLLLRRRSIA